MSTDFDMFEAKVPIIIPGTSGILFVCRCTSSLVDSLVHLRACYSYVPLLVLKSMLRSDVYTYI